MNKRRLKEAGKATLLFYLAVVFYLPLHFALAPHHWGGSKARAEERSIFHRCDLSGDGVASKSCAAPILSTEPEASNAGNHQFCPLCASAASFKNAGLGTINPHFEPPPNEAQGCTVQPAVDATQWNILALAPKHSPPKSFFSFLYKA